MADFRKKPSWREENLVVETPLHTLMSPLVITAHVFYPEFATKLINSLKKLPQETKVYATTSSLEIKHKLIEYFETAGNPHDVRLTPNIGRNFGPLLNEFSKELLKEESFIHVHSKRSPHSPNFSKIWLKRNTDLLLTPRGVQRISSIIDSNINIGLVYADSTDLLRGINFRWGRSLNAGKNLLSHMTGFEGVKWSGRLSFPSGGMFWVKTVAITPLLEFPWEYEFFPEEIGQVDGALHHSLERVIGELVLARKWKHAVYLEGIDRFVLKSDV